MKNRQYNRIILCGLLSSSFALLGMENQLAKSSDAIKPNQSFLDKMENKAEKVLHLGSGHVSPGKVSPRLSTGDASLTPKSEKMHRSRSNSANTPVDPNNPASKHHGHHFKEKAKEVLHVVEKDIVTIEHLIATYGALALQDIINNPELITEILTTVGISQAQAQSITSMMVVGASKAQITITDIDTVVQNALAKHLAAQQAAALQALQSQQTKFQQMEGDVVNPLVGILSFINSHPTVMATGLTLTLGSVVAEEVMNAEKEVIPNLVDGLKKIGTPSTSTTDASSTQAGSGQAEVDQTTVAPQTSGFSNIVIGGGATVFLALLTGLLHSKGYLPASISQILSNIIQSITASATTTK